MTEAALTADIAEAEDGLDAVAPVKPNKRKKLMLIAAAIVLLLLGIGGGAWWFLTPTVEAKPPPASAEELVDVPPMTVNLRSADGANHVLKVRVMLVPGTADKETIKARLPLVLDGLQPFLRELRPEDVAGAAATFRIKEEMLVRANAAIGEGAVRDVLIQDLLQQ